MLALATLMLTFLQPIRAQNFLVLADVHLNVNSTTAYAHPGDETSLPMLYNVIDEAKKEI
jgi:metallophosphoesterase superfamily enzyme